MDDASFLQAYFLLEAYLLSNSLSYESPNLKMPHWVLIDCVLMQTAVVGFTIAKSAVPEELLSTIGATRKSVSISSTASHFGPDQRHQYRQ